MMIGTAERARRRRQTSKPSTPGQPDVEDDEPDRVARELGQRLLPGPHPEDAEAVAVEVGADERPDRLLVLDEHDHPAGRAVRRHRTPADQRLARPAEGHRPNPQGPAAR